MGEPARRAMTADEFLAWDDGTDTRHELVDGDDRGDGAADRRARHDRGQRRDRDR